MAKDIYEEVRAFSQELSDLGESTWSQTLQDAMASGTLPGEVIGATRHQLEMLRKSDDAGRLNLYPRIDEIIRLFEALPPPWNSWGKRTN